MEEVFAPDRAPLSVEVLVVPGTTLLQIAALVDPLRATNRLLGRAQFSWEFTTPDGAPAPSPSGLDIPAVRAFRAEGRLPLFVTGSYGIEGQMSPGLVRRLGEAGRRRPLVAGIEAGVWLIARAGLLSGRRATTHWEDLDAFAARFPEIEVTRRRFVLDGRRATAGGSGPALDLMLELIRRRLGYALALDVARLFVYDPSPREEQDAAPRMLGRPLSPPVSRAVAAMEGRLEDPLAIAEVARAAGVSPRHLQDLFLRDLGTGPSAHYQALRLNRARRRLIETAEPVLEIAEAAGFLSAAAFSRAYRRLHGESPSETRRAARA